MTARQHRLRHRQQESPRQGVPSHTLQNLIFRKVRSRDTTFPAQRDPTFQDGIGRGCILRPIHGSPESNEIQSVFWTLKPAPRDFLDIVCFVERGLVRFVGMRKLRVKKSLSKITGGLKSYVDAVKAHLDLKSVRVRRATRTHVLQEM